MGFIIINYFYNLLKIIMNNISIDLKDINIRFSNNEHITLNEIGLDTLSNEDL